MSSVDFPTMNWLNGLFWLGRMTERQSILATTAEPDLEQGHPWMILFSVALSLFMVVIDVSILSIAMPTLSLASLTFSSLLLAGSSRLFDADGRFVDAAAFYLRARSDVSGKIAAMGWCYGGGVALTYALGGEDHDATAIFYGRLLDDPEKLRHLNHEIYGTFAGLDQGPSPEQAGNFVAALREAGLPNDIHTYDGVNHAFWLFVDQDFAKRNAPGLDAWQRLKTYLSRTIGL